MKMKELSRRNFFAGMAATGALAAAGLAVGCSPAKDAKTQAVAEESTKSLIPNGYYIREDLADLSFPDEGDIAFVADPISDSDVAEEATCDVLVIGAGPAGLCDVLVIGAGPAGLCAAASAADNGLNVILLEKSSVISAHATCLGNYNSKVFKEAGFTVEEQTVLDCARVASQFRCNENVWKRISSDPEKRPIGLSILSWTNPGRRYSPSRATISSAGSAGSTAGSCGPAANRASKMHSNAFAIFAWKRASICASTPLAPS